MFIFIVVPLALVIVFAFTGGDGGVTLENFLSMGDYAAVFVRSLVLALISTAVCLLIGYPLAYILSREGRRFRSVAMMLVMLPMWINFVLRTNAWLTLLENNA
jgi:spermidine/putrescine transport system permease protein